MFYQYCQFLNDYSSRLRFPCLSFSLTALEVGKNNKVCVCVGGGSFRRLYQPLVGPLQHASVVSEGDWSVCEAMHRWSDRLAAHSPAPRGEFFPECNVSLSPTKFHMCILMIPPILNIYFNSAQKTGQCNAIPCKP